MNGYLVLVRCGIDELPIFLTEDREEADAVVASTVREFGEKRADAPLIARYLELTKLDTSIFYGVDVIEYRDGLPVAVHRGAGLDDSLWGKPKP